MLSPFLVGLRFLKWLLAHYQFLIIRTTTLEVGFEDVSRELANEMRSTESEKENHSKRARNSIVIGGVQPDLLPHLHNERTPSKFNSLSLL